MIKEPNYTQIPNSLIAALPELSDPELRIMLVMCRNTFGWHREWHPMSISYIMTGTGLCRASITSTTQKLMKRGLIDRQPDGQSFAYRVVVHPLESASSPAEPVHAVASSPDEPVLVHGVNTTKKVLKKEIPPIVPQEEFRLESEGVERKQKRTPEMVRLGALFRRRENTIWSPAELKAIKCLSPIPEEELQDIERYYRQNIPEQQDYRRKDLVTLLNNWNGELDRARRRKDNTGF